MRWLWLILFSLVGNESLATRAGNSAWRARAREHFEVQRFDKDQINLAEYRGLTNTLNFWYEAPPYFYFGLGLNPMIGSLKAKQSTLLTSLIRHYHLGIEGKVNLGFFKLKSQEASTSTCLICRTYLRIGGFRSWIDNGGNEPTLHGLSGLAALIYHLEFDKLDVAFEVGKRYGRYERGISMDGDYVAVGFHFLPGKDLL